MIETFRNAWKVPELRKKLLFTLFFVILYRIGGTIPVPYLDAAALSSWFEASAASGNFFSYLNVLSGGNFSQATLLALSVSPYINAQIIIQLLTYALPPLEKLSKEGPEGRKKINEWTRYVAVVLAIMESAAMAIGFGNKGYFENGFGATAVIVSVVSLTAGSTFLMWLLTEIYDKMPEIGDMELPKMAFFFDEAHMLFKDTSKALTDKIEQIVRLIRSKGIGVYFISQSPSDLPETILGQCGNRVQHALRAFTPKDQAAVKSAAQTFRPNPAFETEREILELGTGEALVSFLDEKGAPSMVQKAKILFPLSQIGAITTEQRSAINASSRISGKYETLIDRESAFEQIAKQREAEEKEKQEIAVREAEEKEEKRKQKESSRKSKSSTGKSIFTTVIGTAITYFAKTMATQLARNLTKKTKKK